MDQIQIWPNTSIANTIQQLGDAARQGVGNVQILLDLLDERNHTTTTEARQGNEDMQRCEEVNDRERWLMQWYEFRKKVGGGTHNQVDGKIQVLGPHVHQDVLAILDTGCERFLVELETQLGGARDVQGQLAQGTQQLPNAVDTKLVQNDQRNNAQEGTIRDICTEFQNLGVQIGQKITQAW